MHLIFMKSKLFSLISASIILIATHLSGQLSPGSFDIYFDPSDPTSYGPERNSCQLIVAGNRFNTGDDTDGIQAGSGYGLNFDNNIEVHSFVMEDGDSFRYGSKTVSGLQIVNEAICHKHQYKNDGSYDISQQVNGLNFSTTFPGIDRIFYDGTRTQLSCIPNSAADQLAIKVGPDCDHVQLVTTFKIEQWMFAADIQAIIGSLHEPGVGVPGPLVTYAGDYGNIIFTTREKDTPVTSTDKVFTPINRATISIAPADIGKWWSVAYSYCVDPESDDGFLHIWLDKGEGFEQIVAVNEPWGWWNGYSNQLNELFYPIMCTFYSWHQFTNYPNEAPNNWDDTYGNVREMCYAYSGLSINGSLTPQQLMDHAYAYTGDRSVSEPDCPGGSSTITIYARGNTGQEDMSLTINGQTYGNWNNISTGNSGTYHTYSVTINDQLSINSIRVNSVSGQDWPNALVVDKIVIDGITYQSEANTTESYGSHDQATGCAQGYKNSEWLSCANGWFEYQAATGNALAVDYSTIFIYARGNTGQEDMSLTINGQTLATWDDIPTGNSDFFTTRSLGTIQQFTINSIRINSTSGLDWPNALIVDKIVIDGITYQSEASTTESYGSHNQATACAQGYKNSEWLSCANGWFEYQAANGVVMPCGTDSNITDQDNDGIPNTSDNCPNTSNANQIDTDNDGQGDVCDASPNGEDADEDGYTTHGPNPDPDDNDPCVPSAEAICSELPSSQLTIDINPDDINTWGPNRSEGQWIVGGDRFNPGASTGNIFGLSFQSNGTVRSPFTFQNGDDRVLYTDMVGGVNALCTQYQFVNDGSYQAPPANGGQGYVNSPPSTPLFFDGSRGDLSFLNSTMRVGPGCTPFNGAFTFWGEDWHMASDATTAVWEFHAPVGTSGTSPVGMSIQNGQLTVFGRYSSTPVNPAININNQTQQQILGSVPINIGNWNTVGISGCVDPDGAGYFRLWTADEQGYSVAIDYGNGFGYYLTDASQNDDFYHQLKQYDFHQYPAATAPNWDDSYGNVRRMSWRSFSISSDPNVSEADMYAHSLSRADLCCTGSVDECPDFISEFSQPIINNDKQAEISIQTNGYVPQFENVTYQAGESVMLLDQFEVLSGATFNVVIAPCY